MYVYILFLFLGLQFWYGVLFSEYYQIFINNMSSVSRNMRHIIHVKGHDDRSCQLREDLRFSLYGDDDAAFAFPACHSARGSETEAN